MVISVVQEYQKANNLNTLEMCEIMGMGSTSTYSGFIHKNQDTKLNYLINFINYTGITFDEIINKEYKSNELNGKKNDKIQETEKDSEKKLKQCTEFINEQRRTIRNQDRHIEELYMKIKRLKKRNNRDGLIENEFDINNLEGIEFKDEI